MGEIIDVLAQEIFVRRAAFEPLESAEADVTQRGETLARLCYDLAEGFLRYARSRTAGGAPGDPRAH